MLFHIQLNYFPYSGVSGCMHYGACLGVKWYLFILCCFYEQAQTVTVPGFVGRNRPRAVPATST